MLTLRFITSGSEMMLPRMWPFQDVMAARSDVRYSVHLLGPYRQDPAALQGRDFVHSRLPRSRAADEVWLLRGWNRRRLVAAAYAARLRGIPLMLWHETPGRTFEATNLKAALRIRVRELALPQIFRAYRGCVLLGIGELAVTRFRQLAPGSDVHLLPYPDHQADALISRPAAAGPSGPPALLFVGELSRRKGVDVLMAATEALWGEGLDFVVRYAGTGPMSDDVRDHAQRHLGRVQLLGGVSGEALLDLYSQADGFVLPSRWDAWGLVVHEALAAGLPAIVTRNVGARALVGECGQIVAPDDPRALAEALRWWLSLRTQHRRAIAQRGKETAAGLTMDRIADRLLSYAGQALQRAAPTT